MGWVGWVSLFLSFFVWLFQSWRHKQINLLEGASRASTRKRCRQLSPLSTLIDQSRPLNIVSFVELKGRRKGRKARLWIDPIPATNKQVEPPLIVRALKRSLILRFQFRSQKSAGPLEAVSTTGCIQSTD